MIAWSYGGLRFEASTGKEAEELTLQMARLLSLKEVAEMLGVTPRTLYRWSTEGRFPVFRPGGLTLAEVTAFVYARQPHSIAVTNETLDSLPAKIADKIRRSAY